MSVDPVDDCTFWYTNRVLQQPGQRQQRQLADAHRLVQLPVVLGHGIPADGGHRAASGITAAAATLNGTVSSNGASTTVTFQYGLTTGYGSTATAAQSPLAAGASGAPVTGRDQRAGLQPALPLPRGRGQQRRHDQRERRDVPTAACTPTAVTSAASAIGATGATLNGTVSQQRRQHDRHPSSTG